MGKFFGALLLLLAVALAGAWFYGQHLYTQQGPQTPDGGARIVIVAKGANVQNATAALKKAGAIDDELHFRTVVRVLDFLPGAEKLDLKAGEYAVPSGATMKQIIALLSSGASLQYNVVIPEGLTSAMIIRLLAKSEWEMT